MITIFISRNSLSLFKKRKEIQGTLFYTKPPTLCLFPEFEKHPCEFIKEIEDDGGFSKYFQDFKYICTHSEALINWIGEQIGKGKMKPDEVQIVDITNYDNPITMTYDIEGYIEDAKCYGFFSHHNRE